MTPEKTSIEKLFARLHAKSATLSQAFLDKKIVPNDENRTDIGHLVGSGALIKGDVDAYYVFPPLRRAVEAMAGDVHVRRIDVGLADRLDDLKQLVDMHQAATQSMNYEGAAEWRTQIEDILAEISVSMDSATRQLEMQIKSGFSQYKSIAEKQSQTHYFSKQAQKLLDAIESFNNSQFLEKMRDHHEIYTQLYAARNHRLPIYMDRLRIVISELKASMFAFRAIETRTRHLRQMHTFLESNPAWQLRDMTLETEVPAFFNVAPAVSVGGYPVIDHPSYGDVLADVAMKLPAVAPGRVRHSRGTGVLIETEQKIVEAVRKPVEAELQKFAISALHGATSGLSALAYYRTHHIDQIADLKVWLYIILVRFQRNESFKKHFVVDIVSTKNQSERTHLAGNLVVCDVVVAPRVRQLKLAA